MMKTLKIPFGPQHPALEEPINFMFEVEEERVVNVKFRLGYIHKGIEKLAESRTFFQNIYLAERICGICSFAHTTCYVQTVEELLGATIPLRAEYIRTIILEMERIQNHYLWLGFLAKEMGFETIFMYSWRDREEILGILEKISGKRVNYGLNTIGGVRRDIKTELIESILNKLSYLQKRAENYRKLCIKDKIFIKRTRGVGILKPKKALTLSAVGPTLRASGISRDVRFDDPYVAYASIPFKIITYNGCDVASRTLVRIDELIESIKIIKTSLNKMPAGKLNSNLGKKIIVPKGENSKLVEAPRGEDFHYIKSNGSEKPARYKVRSPTLANIPSLLEMMKDINIADIPVVISGIDPCIACAERILLIDPKKKKKSIFTNKDLWEYSNSWYNKNY